MEAGVAERDAGSTTVPFIIPASNDGQYLAAPGVKVYDFSPMKY